MAGTLPLWVTGHLPFVDQPQHLYLIGVLHRLGDGTTLYPADRLVLTYPVRC